MRFTAPHSTCNSLLNFCENRILFINEGSDSFDDKIESSKKSLKDEGFNKFIMKNPEHFSNMSTEELKAVYTLVKKLKTKKEKENENENIHINMNDRAKLDYQLAIQNSEWTPKSSNDPINHHKNFGLIEDSLKDSQFKAENASKDIQMVWKETTDKNLTPAMRLNLAESFLGHGLNSKQALTLLKAHYLNGNVATGLRLFRAKNLKNEPLFTKKDIEILMRTYLAGFWKIPVELERQELYIGDFNGNIKAWDNLISNGIVDPKNPDKWIAGNVKVIFHGDILGDRDKNGLEILTKIANLRKQAEAVGGIIVVHPGNHEDYVFALKDGYLAFKEKLYPVKEKLEKIMQYPGSKEFEKTFEEISKLYPEAISEILKMKIVEEGKDSISFHTDPTLKMKQYIEKYGVDYINTNYQKGLKALIVGKMPSDTYYEIKLIFLDSKNRHKKIPENISINEKKIIFHGHSDHALEPKVGKMKNLEDNSYVHNGVRINSNDYGRYNKVDSKGNPVRKIRIQDSDGTILDKIVPEENYSIGRRFRDGRYISNANAKNYGEYLATIDGKYRNSLEHLQEGMIIRNLDGKYIKILNVDNTWKSKPTSIILNNSIISIPLIPYLQKNILRNEGISFINYSGKKLKIEGVNKITNELFIQEK